MDNCPRCNSTNLRFRTKFDNYICNNCKFIFADEFDWIKVKTTNEIIEFLNKATKYPNKKLEILELVKSQIKQNKNLGL